MLTRNAARPSEQHASLWSDSSTADKPVRAGSRPATFHDGSGRVIDAGISKPLRQDIDVFLHELLDLRFPDWADAEGSRGELEWTSSPTTSNTVIHFARSPTRP